jgi:hypothetical protein
VRSQFCSCNSAKHSPLPKDDLVQFLFVPLHTLPVPLPSAATQEREQGLWRKK